MNNEMAKDARRLQRMINAATRDYWTTHGRVVEELPCADEKAAKIFADAYGYKYAGDGRYYKNANDIHNRYASEDDVATLIKRDGMLYLKIVVIQ